jgi:hypothetical protein
MSGRGFCSKLRSLFLRGALCAGLLFSSCENSAFIPPFEEEQDGNINASIKSGDAVLPGEEIRLSMVYDSATGNPPDSLEIEIIAPDGESLGVEIISGSVLLEELPPVLIEDSRNGLYEIRTRLMDEKGALIREDGIPFFKVEQLPVIRRVEVYPPEAVSPGSSGLMIPRIEGAENAWLRWTMGPQLLGRGAYGEYREGLIWKAPENEGVYTLLLEVFPGIPADPERGFDFDSPVNAEIQVYVQKRQGSRGSELGPEAQFRNLLHLQGSLRDHGALPVEVLVTGEPRPAVMDGIFGYRLGSGDALVLPDIGFPGIDGKAFSPFTVKIIFTPDLRVSSLFQSAAGPADRAATDSPREGHLFSFSEKGDGQALMCVVDTEGTPHLAFTKAGMEMFRTDNFQGEYKIADCRELSVSFVPGPETVLVKWYCNGRCIGINEVPEELFPEMEEMKLQLGGGFGELQGFEMLIDEFGLFFMDSEKRYAADEDVFLRWTKRSLGERAVLAAEGFENEAADEMIVNPGETRVLVNLEPEWAGAVVHIWMEGSPMFPEGTSLLFRGTEGAVQSVPIGEIFPELNEADSYPTGKELVFEFERGNGGFFLRSMKGEVLYHTGEWGSEPVTIAVKAGEGRQESGPEGLVKIKEILVTRERSNLTDRGEGSPDNQKVAYALKQR